jgi:hypothetical protein
MEKERIRTKKPVWPWIAAIILLIVFMFIARRISEHSEPQPPLIEANDTLVAPSR